jgi:cysteinyl-tRNA synthetase
MQALFLYNTLTRKKEEFKPLNPPFVGLYVCGPTVYSDVHLGNCRTFVSFDLIYRYLLHLGYKVRYVRNITDAGHLEGDRDEGDDKFAKKAKLEQLEPMEIVQKYTVGFRNIMKAFNTLPPSIEPTATGHICEQIEMIKQIIQNGLAYEKNGTVYFDVEKYSTEFNYGQLTNRKLEELLEGTRELSGQDEKKGRLDFALWIKAKPETLMHWPSPWGWGFPGWHIECSAMACELLGQTFDIHGGGADLQFPHHENEIAQSEGANGQPLARFWMHNGFINVDNEKMSKSLGNFFTIRDVLKAFDAETVRFFIVRSHYRSSLNYSDVHLNDAKGALKRLYTALQAVPPAVVQIDWADPLAARFKAAMDEDFGTPEAVAVLFDLASEVNRSHSSDRRLIRPRLPHLPSRRSPTSR